MKSKIILEDALRLIAEGTTDTEYPLRAAPRDVLRDYAKDAIKRYDASEIWSRLDCGVLLGICADCEDKDCPLNADTRRGNYEIT